MVELRYGRLVPSASSRARGGSGGAVYVLRELTSEPGKDEPGKEPCLDGHRIDDPGAAIEELPVDPAVTVRLSLSDRPGEYGNGDRSDLRRFVVREPGHDVVLRLDDSGRAIAVGEPWLP